MVEPFSQATTLSMRQHERWTNRLRRHRLKSWSIAGLFFLLWCLFYSIIHESLLIKRQTHDLLNLERFTIRKPDSKSDALILSKSLSPYLMDINHTLCTFHQMNKVFPRPNVDFPILYTTAKFRVGDSSKTHELYDMGCFVLRSQMFRENELWVFQDEFPPFVRDHPQYKRHRQFLNNSSDDSKKGAGYWFWKPLIVLEILLSDYVAMNTVVIYTDADRLEAPSFVGPVIEAMAERGHNFAIQQFASGTESEWTKGDMLELFGVYNDSAILETPQLLANFFVVQKSPSTIEFIRQWAKLMENYHAVSNEPSIIPNHVGFVDNRHDQSMLGLLLKVVYHDGWGTKTELMVDLDEIYPSSEREYNECLILHTYNLSHDER